MIIPAYNEEQSIAKVIRDIPKDLVRDIIVCNNGSKDKTESIAKENGAIVLRENERGYGAACLKAIDYIRQNSEKPDVIAFLDADYSDHPEELPFLVQEIKKGNDLVIGNRTSSQREKGSMTPQQVFGNKLATWLMKVFYNIQFSDLGPFRAIKWDALEKIQMSDRNWGWTVEMQLKVGKSGLKYTEVPVSYRKRIGQSKVSGTVKGTIMAGYKILYTIFKYR